MHPTSRQRRFPTSLSMRRAGLVFALLAGLASSAGATNRIFAIVYDGPDALDPNLEHLRSNLQSVPDNIVTWRRGPFEGTLATLLQQSSFDQVWIWDMDIYPPFVNADDRAALATWYAAHPNVVLDSRSVGVFADNDAAEQTLTHNIVAQLAARSGGLWIGAKHATEGTQTAHAYLSQLQSGLFTGSWQDDQVLTGSNSPLLAGIADIQALRWFHHDAFSRSAAPTLGPGGVPLNTVLSDADGHPLITTTIPEPPQGLLGGLGAGALGWLRRRR